MFLSENTGTLVKATGIKLVWCFPTTDALEVLRNAFVSCLLWISVTLPMLSWHLRVLACYRRALNPTILMSYLFSHCGFLFSLRFICRRKKTTCHQHIVAKYVFSYPAKPYPVSLTPICWHSSFFTNSQLVCLYPLSWIFWPLLCWLVLELIHNLTSKNTCLVAVHE